MMKLFKLYSSDAINFEKKNLQFKCEWVIDMLVHPYSVHKHYYSPIQLNKAAIICARIKI